MESKQMAVRFATPEVFVQFLVRSKKKEIRKENDYLLWFHFPKYSSSSHT
jgi:hypothetical protein